MPGKEGCSSAIAPSVRVQVRKERPDDAADVFRVVSAAFQQAEEAELVGALRRSGSLVLSLVAVCGAETRREGCKTKEEYSGGHDTIVGHIAFSRCFVGDKPCVLLAPLAVAPSHQKKGVGAALTKRGTALLREQGEQVVLVLGHPKYYPRFGFDAQFTKAINASWPHSDAFMGLALDPSPEKAGVPVAGDLRIASAFDALPDDH